MRRARDDFSIRRHLGRDLHRHIGLALVVEHDQVVGVFCLGIGIAQLHGEISGIAAAEAIDRHAAGERTDETDFDLVFGVGTCAHRTDEDDGSQMQKFPRHGGPLS